MPTPPRVFTAEERNQAEILAGVGIPQTMIATLLRCDKKTLEKYLAPELEYGSAKATAKVAQTLFQKAIAGDNTCMIFWLKCRAGWKEVDRVEVTGADGGAVQIEAVRDRIVGRISRLAAERRKDRDTHTIEAE